MSRLCMLLLLIVSMSASAEPSKPIPASLVIAVIECESSGKHDAIGDDGVSYGIAQFRKETFYEFSKQAGFKNMLYKNPIHQLKVMVWALEHGYGNRWACYRKLKNSCSF